MCPVTCNLCEPEGGATSSPATEPSDPNVCEDKANNCPALLDYCNSDQTAEMMNAQCKKSCGFCSDASESQVVTTASPTPSSGCEDDPSLDCSKYTSFCSNQGTEVPNKCKRTCGFCPDQKQTTPAATSAAPTSTTTPAQTTAAATTAKQAPVCKDKMPGCGKYKKYCKAPRYKAKLSNSCASTCNMCPGGAGAAPAGTTKAPQAAAPAGECRDNTPKQCPSLKKYCKAPKYKKMMMQKCKKTCGWCDGGATATTTSAAPAAAGTV